MENKEAERFKFDVAKFSGHYREFIVIAKTAEGRLFWKSSDKTWSLGAIQRYMNCVDEMDRVDERQQMLGFGEEG